MKAEKLIKLALFDIGKNGITAAVKPEDSEIAIDSLNMLMYQYAKLGLGYTEVESGGDDITTPNYSWRWMRYKLALELCDQFGKQENYIQISNKVNDAYRDLCKALIPMPFYEYSFDAITTEQNDIIVTEDS